MTKIHDSLMKLKKFYDVLSVEASFDAPLDVREDEIERLRALIHADSLESDGEYKGGITISAHEPKLLLDHLERIKLGEIGVYVRNPFHRHDPSFVVVDNSDMSFDFADPEDRDHPFLLDVHTFLSEAGYKFRAHTYETDLKTSA